jgi:hypothetical protein
VFLHELGHIGKGHTLLVAKEFGLPFIDELRMASSGSGIGETDAHALEMDADVFAITAVILQVMSGSKSGSWIDPRFEELNGVGAASVASALFAIYLICRMFDEACGLGNVGIRSHPSAPMRQGMILAMALDVLSKQHGFEAAKAEAVLVAAMMSAERCYGQMRGRPIDLTAIEYSVSQEGQKYVEGLIRNLGVLRPRLELLCGGNA